GGDNIKPLTGSSSLILQNSQLDLGLATNLEGFSAVNRDGKNMLDVPSGPGHFGFDQIDLTGIISVDITAGSEESLIQGYKIWVKLDGPEGRTIGETTISTGNTDTQRLVASVKIEPVTDGKLHDLYILTEPLGEEEEAMALISIELKAE